MGWSVGERAVSRVRRALAILVVVAAASVTSACTFEVSLGDEPAAPVSTNLDDFRFDRLDVDYTLTRADDGTSRLDVVERFVAVFPEYDQNRGMRRSIPDSYQSAPLRPEFVSVTDAEGDPRPIEVTDEDGVFTMTSRADDYLHGEQVFVFTYRLQNVTRYFDDTGVDEFYWDVIGPDSPQPFGEVTAALHVDGALADALTGDAACYVGEQGADATCPIEVTDAGAEASIPSLAPFQVMTVAVAFERGTFTPFDGSYLASPWGWAQGVAGLGALGALVWAFVVRVRRLRDDPGRPTIIAEYTPPPGIDALESAVLLGRSTKAIPAEVLEQAVVGSIRIVEGEKRWFGGVKLKAVLVDPSRADGDGRMLLDGLFPDGSPGDEFEFGRQDTSFSSAAQKILKTATAELTRRGLRRKVSNWTRAWPIIVAGIAAVLVFLTGAAALTAAVTPWVPILVIIGAALVEVLVIVLVVRSPLTAAGAEVRDHLKGLEVFIDWAEADRIRMLQSPAGAERLPVDPGDPRQMLRLYESLLPYAVVFGQEKKWAEELAVFYDRTGSPGWYSGSSGFQAGAFAAGISTLSSSASSSSSTSGGSSGGGSAGGGGGGGGTGGV